MGNYSLVINSKFNPFSYQDMLAPVLMATQAHQELENQYGELEAKADIWENLANEQTDPYAYKMYKTFANDLEEKAGLLAKEGLNVSSRKNMLNMRARYNKEIVPIEKGYEAKQSYIKNLMQARANDPSLIVDRFGEEISLDEFVRNPFLAPKTYSGNVIATISRQAAQAFAKEVAQNPDKYRSILGNSYYEIKYRKGLTTEDVYNTILNNENSNAALRSVIEDAVKASGISGWKSERALNEAYNWANSGAWSAVGETQSQIVDNWRAKTAAQNAVAYARLAEDKRQFNAKMKANGYNPDGTSINPNPSSDNKGKSKGNNRELLLKVPFTIDTDGEVEYYAHASELPLGATKKFSELSSTLRNAIKKHITDIPPEYYSYSYIAPGAFNKAKVVIVAKESVIGAEEQGNEINIINEYRDN